METNDTTILHELLTLQKESNERDTRIESKMDSLDMRMGTIEKHSDKQDQQIEKLTEILADQKNLSKDLTQYKKDTDEKIQKNTNDIKINSDAIAELKNTPAKNALAIWKQIGSIALTGLVTTIVGVLIGKFL